MSASSVAGRPLVLDCTIFGLQRFGGISNYWSHLVDGLSYHDGRVRLVVPDHVRYEGSGPAGCEGAELFRERLPVAIARYLRCPAERGAVFHTSYYRLPDRPVARYVVTAYDFIYERYRTGLAKLVHHQQKRASLTRADAVICISDSTRRDVLHFCPDVDPDRLHVVPLGIDDSAFRVSAAPFVPEDRPTVLFVGQRNGYKRFDLAVEALALMPLLSLGVVGGGALTEVERTMMQRRLGERWTDFGQVSAERLRSLYATSFAFVFPSEYEGFGLPILEAMASGCPVVSSAGGSLPEVGGDVAIYAADQTAESYAAAIASLLDLEHRRRRIAAGLLRCRFFSWARTVALTEAIYRDDPVAAAIPAEHRP